MAVSEHQVFLSYRREDAAGHAGRLADYLLDRFGQGSVFMDVESIEAGVDFTVEIERAIAEADAVLVVIGPRWLEVRAASGARRLEEPGDFVRREIEAALRGDVRVIPVLVGGATMPAESELPRPIAALALRNAVELFDRRWREDVGALVEVLEGRDRAAVGNLPTQTTPFLGREREVEEVTELLRREDVRLITITGPGGIGKTRIAMHAASSLATAYWGGAWFVGLATLSDPELVLLEIARVLEVRDDGDARLVDAIARRLSRARTLIVLDNLEHLLPDAAAPIAELSGAVPSLDLITTSRQPLRVTAERDYSLGTLVEDDGIALFVARAQASRPDFELRDEAARDATAAICARLDGLPLAIELAASRMSILTPEELLPRLEQRLAVLTGGARDLPARQQTLRATVDWSYELLPSAERRLFARLSVFAGGWTLRSAEAVCALADDDRDILDGMGSLVDSSLVQRWANDGLHRFSMLETVREYASDLLRGGEEFDEVARRHAEYLLSQAERAHSELLGPNPESWFDRLEPELDNFRASVASSLEQGRISLAMRIMAALMRSLEPRGYWQEARALGLDEVLARSEDLRLSERGELLFAAGSLSGFQGRTAPAQTLLEQAIEAARDVGDRPTLARALARLAWVRVVHGEDVDESIALGEEGVGLARAIGDPWLLAEALNDLSSAYGDLDYSPRAVSLIEESLELRRSIGYAPGVADSLNNLGWQALLSEDYLRAVEYLEESVELARRLSQKPFMLFARDNLALAQFFSGETELADELFRDNLRLCREMGDQRIAEEALTGLAGVAASAHEWDRAAWLAGAAIALSRELELLQSTISFRIRERYLSAAQEALGAELYEAHFRRGEVASFEQAIAYALDEAPSG
jgi:predicted ATPase